MAIFGSPFFIAIRFNDGKQYCLFGSRHYKLSTFGNAFWPALHYALLFGVEANAFLAICVHIAKEGLLPSTKTMPSHWYWDRHVNTNHANLNATGKLACNVAVTSKASDTVTKFARIN